jgi:murein hydrolase activator
MKKLLILLCCFLSALAVQAQPSQEKAKLEKERQELQKEMQDIQANYNKVKGLTKGELAKLQILQRKVDVQDRLIGNINKDIRRLNDDIYLNTLEINRLQREMDTMKAQYARSVVYAYMNQSSYEFINFIFSSDNFNEAMKRVDYLKTYRAYRKQQVAEITEKKRQIEDKKQTQLARQNEKKSVLQDQKVQMNELENQKKEKDAVVSKLKSQEKKLSKEIATKKKRDNQLRNQINAVIAREMKAARDAAEKTKGTAVTTPDVRTTTKPKTSAPKSFVENLNAKDMALAADFEKNRGKLFWPVDNGVVTIPYGSSVVGGLSVDNPGITISTPNAGSSVKAIFTGEVSAVSNLGDAMMVIIRHGKYFSVYSNLASVSVKKGEQVTANQIIGKTNTADDGDGGQVDLILMNESKNINPAPWLRH